MGEQLLSDLIIGDDASLKGAGDLDRLRDPPKHFLGFLAHGHDLLLFDSDRHNRGFLEQDLAPFGDTRVKGAQIDAQFLGEHRHESL